ncbi:Mov34/MPN/PAD-1 family protein [Actinomadura monticuli]|uniref:M67 family metallopeptidase n=1 Tax=Actinomadura monticuli TaxID=3097367 RepID=A0ABV4Q616_9ACTN
MRISQELAEAMIAHALEEHPIEACGILCGPEDLPARVVPMENELDSETAYALEPAQQLSVWEGMYDRGEELAGTYHSHTRHEAYPSPRDVEYAVYDVPHLIICTKGGPVLRALASIEPACIAAAMASRSRDRPMCVCWRYPRSC